MSAEPSGMQISIMGREFRVACEPAEQKALQEAVEYLNRIAIMAALNISHEFLTTRFGGFDVADFKRRMAGIETTLDQALADQEKLF